MAEYPVLLTCLGLDVGTSGVKAVLTDENGRTLARAGAPLDISRPHPGWSEQWPDDWWTACKKAIDEIGVKCPDKLSALRVIGLSGQMHGATLLDANDRVLRPAILWNDARSGAQCAQLEAELPRSRTISGNIAMAGFTAPKILWLRENEPDVYRRIAKILLPKDYVRFCLSADYATDMSDASGTLWLDVGKRDWSDELLTVTGLTRSHMPALFEGTEITGLLKPELARRWNISGDVRIAAGGGDNAAAACGIGAIRPDTGFVSLGTSGVLFVSTDSFRPNTTRAVHAFCHAVPGTWHQMGVILSATDSLNWIARMTGRSARELAKGVAEGFSGPTQETFLPYLAGERTPHNDPDAKGAFVGLSHRSDPLSLAHAVMEGVAFAFRDSHEALLAAGTTIDSLHAVGGGSCSALWLRMIASSLGISIHVFQDADLGAAFGAARLGLCALNKADPLQICSPPETVETIDPDPALSEIYDRKYRLFQSLYPAIHEVI